MALGLLIWHRPRLVRPGTGPTEYPPNTGSTQRNELVQIRPPNPRSFHAAPTHRTTSELVAEIQAAITSGDPNMLDYAITNLLPRLMLTDVAAAAQFAETNQCTQVREEFLLRVAELWAAQDHQSALAWAATLTNATERIATIDAVCLHIAQADPAQALQVRQQSIEQDQPDWLTPCLVQQWAEKDSDAALAWALSQPPGKVRDESLARIAFVLARSKPWDAAQLVANQITPGDEQVEAAISVLHQWARLDPAAAKAWVNCFPEGPLRDRAIAELEPGVYAHIPTTVQSQ